MARAKNKRNGTRAVEEPVEILDEGNGAEVGIDAGIILTTSLFLLASVALVVTALANHYNAGPLGGS